ncbi:Calmodulin [Spironucleus salmonicida]|uniref:Calmodulin n=1 Tax=Spironucleus salmonicida TaxID=348837 RepID=V6LI62_9EUKA|nr:Calmodulin [Spironucleus salmonicida]|eukprot:EST44008.1 Calmodulin [Spironucleus salmonicida]
MSRDQIKQLFDKFDSNNDNQLSKIEIQQMFHQLDIQIQDEQFETVFNLFDQDLNQYLTRAEFEHMIFVVVNCNLSDFKSLLFYAADIDHSMRLNVDELTQLFIQLGMLVQKQEITIIIEELGSGNQLNYAQFQNLFNKLCE